MLHDGLSSCLFFPQVSFHHYFCVQRRRGRGRRQGRRCYPPIPASFASSFYVSKRDSFEIGRSEKKYLLVCSRLRITQRGSFILNISNVFVHAFLSKNGTWKGFTSVRLCWRMLWNLLVRWWWWWRGKKTKFNDCFNSMESTNDNK